MRKGLVSRVKKTSKRLVSRERVVFVVSRLGLARVGEERRYVCGWARVVWERATNRCRWKCRMEEALWGIPPVVEPALEGLS